MKNLLRVSISWRALVMLAWALFAVTLTTQSDDVPVVHLVIGLIGKTELGATAGHAGLFGLLALVIYAALAARLPGRLALPPAVGLALALGTITEFYQTLVAGRTASLSDLLANWLGVFVVAFVIAYGLAGSPLRQNWKPKP